MLAFSKYICILWAVLVISQSVLATDYYVHAQAGNDANNGTSPSAPFASLSKVNTLQLKAGDRILFAAGQVFEGELAMVGVQGSAAAPIVISSYLPDGMRAKDDSSSKFRINAKGKPNGIRIQDCSHVVVKHAIIEADGYEAMPLPEEQMRIGILIKATSKKACRNIQVDSVEIRNIFFENKGFVRGAEEVKTANGSQRYGWGIRLITDGPTAQISRVEISNSSIHNVSHTGIKLTGQAKNISWVVIRNNKVTEIGGPGIQMSEVKHIHVHHNAVAHSGSNNDSRKWGRGSGLWTWGAYMVLIEHNSFTDANGPGDSAGAHVDYNCDYVIIQYNFSARNAGGFCEILGNNYNCVYRYNVSVDDGHRVKGENGAFQEGKIFWLSGYQGNAQPKKGPINSYFYNNTIYVSKDIVSKIAIEPTSAGVYIANNIFYIPGTMQMVQDDQKKSDLELAPPRGPIVFENNLWLPAAAWPANAPIKDSKPLLADPVFAKPGGMLLTDYIPSAMRSVHQKGVVVQALEGDFMGLPQGMNPAFDILGTPIQGNPPMGAIVPRKQ